MVHRSTVAVIILGALMESCARENVHTDVKIKSFHPWTDGSAKHCMISTGNSPVIGGPNSNDPKLMYCSDHKNTDSNDLGPDFMRIADVHLDDVSSQVFNDGKHFGVPMLCEERSKNTLTCVYDGH